MLLAGVAAAVSGGSLEDPQTPPALPRLPPPFLGTTVLGDGQLSAAVDSYGDIVDLRDGPVGASLIANPAERQAAGTVPSDTGIVPRISIGGGAPLPLWRADRVDQHYLSTTNVLRTRASFGDALVAVEDAVRGRTLARVVTVSGPARQGPAWRGSLSIEEGLDERLACRQRKLPSRLSLTCSPTSDLRANATSESRSAAEVLAAATRENRDWLNRARPLAGRAPAWAAAMYERSLLALRALTDRRTGAVAAGLRDGWAYIWPRDAASVSLAFAAAGYRDEARKVAAFLSGLDLKAAARFDGSGTAIEGREAQGDAWGWTAAANRTAGLAPPHPRPDWRDRADYQEKSPGDYLANALASNIEADRKAALVREQFEAHGVLVREESAASSGIDSAAAWAVRPFTQPALFPAARRSLQQLIRTRGGRFGIVPSEDWPEEDPWTAPTAWAAWAFAALSRNISPADRHGLAVRRAAGDRRLALGLLGDLRRAATPAGMLPERVDAQTGIPRSTTPLAWSHAFAVLALRELWPSHE
jgi:hypothetical protein